VFRAIVLKRVWAAVQRLENAMKKLSIRNTAKTIKYSFRDMYKIEVEFQSV
jgi:hypothetical protein